MNTSSKALFSMAGLACGLIARLGACGGLEDLPPLNCLAAAASPAQVATVAGHATGAAESPVPKFRKRQLSDKFYAEGAYYADFNRDGKLDVVAGPFWYEGPDFQRRHTIREPKTFDPRGYADNFLTYTGDFNGDGWTDILDVPFPGKEAYWYENPAGREEAWKPHLAYPNVGNESPVWGDLNGDGVPDVIVSNKKGTFLHLSEERK